MKRSESPSPSPLSSLGIVGLMLTIVITLVGASGGQMLEEENVIEGHDQVYSNVPYLVDVGPKREFNRIRRQDSSSTTTTSKPKKHRPSNIFNLISVLVSETREDANRAFSEIGSLFNAQFVNGTTTTTTTTTTSTPASNSETEDDEDVASTTEPFRITRNEFFGVLRSNVQGLVQLFGKEFRVAFQDSNRNVREFGRELKNAIWPYFTRPSTPKTSTK